MPDATTYETIALDLGDRSYDISIGTSITDNLERLLLPLLKTRRVFVVSETNVMQYQGKVLRSAFKKAGIEPHWFIVEPGEATKSFHELEKLACNLLTAGIERSDTIIAFGGGVIGDLTGFTAATVLRGINFVQIPTTLLAQVDSSVGGKTGINTPQGKNLVGAFYQPQAVLIDILTLETLPRRELLSGYAEVVKYGVIDDPDFFTWLEENGADIVSPNANNLTRNLRTQAIAHNCRAKARIVTEDERETGKRALLNLGHTFGHALEAECGYSGILLHGEAVAIGMVMALEASVRLGLASADEKERLSQHFKTIGMKTSAAEIEKKMNADALLAHMSKDKKVEAGTIGFILGGIGSAGIHRGIDLEIIRSVLHDSLQGHA